MRPATVYASLWYILRKTTRREGAGEIFFRKFVRSRAEKGIRLTNRTGQRAKNIKLDILNRATMWRAAPLQVPRLFTAAFTRCRLMGNWSGKGRGLECVWTLLLVPHGRVRAVIKRNARCYRIFISASEIYFEELMTVVICWLYSYNNEIHNTKNLENFDGPVSPIRACIGGIFRRARHFFFRLSKCQIILGRRKERFKLDCLLNCRVDLLLI